MPIQVDQRRKIIGIPLEKSLSRTPSGTLVARGYFTSDSRDQIGDIITRGATERALRKYKQWGNIRLMHQPIPVGKVLRIGSEDGLEWNEVEIEVIDPNAAFMVENGLLKALSVGILIDFVDIDFLEDGGWIINDYSLAEISLVDHPANYDAFLKELPVDQGLQMMVRQYGLDAVAGSMQEYLKKEMTNMAKTVENDAVKELEIEEVEEKVVSADAEKDSTAANLEGALVETKEIVELEAAEESVDEEIFEEPELELSDPDNVYKSLEDKIDALTAEVVALKAALEAKAEVPEAEEQADGDVQEEKAAAILNEEEIEPEENSAPANRKGALPDGASYDETEEEPQAKATSLNEALTKYFKAR